MSKKPSSSAFFVGGPIHGRIRSVPSDCKSWAVYKHRSILIDPSLPVVFDAYFLQGRCPVNGWLLFTHGHTATEKRERVAKKQTSSLVQFIGGPRSGQLTSYLGQEMKIVTGRQGDGSLIYGRYVRDGSVDGYSAMRWRG